MIEQIVNKLRNQNIAILGMGKEGKSTYTFIRKYLRDQVITLLDQKDFELENEIMVKKVIGSDYLKNLEQYDLIIKTPGITLKDMDISSIREKITSQMELFLEVNKKNVIGITGTKGKSTTSSLIYEIIRKQNNNVVLAGNIGIPVFDCLEASNEETLFVLEMSSHQLEFLKVSPHIGVILNLFEDHLDHAGSIENYHNIKMNMFRYQDSEDIMIYCSSNENLRKKVEENSFKSQCYPINRNSLESAVYEKDYFIYFKDKKLYDVRSKRNLIGEHNLENISVVLVISELLSLDLDKTKEVIQEFKSLKYRLENIGIVDDVTYYMSMLSTIPEATISDIQALKNVNTLIFGGMDRGISYEKLIHFLNYSNIEHFICMPTTGHQIGRKLPQEKVVFVQTLEEAVKVAKQITKKNAICLLSPAASSYEYFKNYQDKANRYEDLVLKS